MRLGETCLAWTPAIACTLVRCSPRIFPPTTPGAMKYLQAPYLEWTVKIADDKGIHWRWTKSWQGFILAAHIQRTHMETVPTNPDSESKPPQTTIGSRLLNIFAAPGEVFEEVRNSAPSVSNWLVPALIYAVVGVISAFVIFSQPAIVQQIHEQQAKVMDQQVKAGKLTQAQADQALTVMDKFAGPAMLKLFGSLGAVIESFIHIFWWAFILWLMGLLVLKIKIPFLKAAELAGLTTMILVLGAMVTILLTVITGKLGITPSLALAVSDFDIKNKAHLLLAAVNIFSFWQIGVAACGLSRLTGTPFPKTVLMVALYWLAFTLIFIGIGFGQMAL
jgi:hypothetical protein